MDIAGKQKAVVIIDRIALFFFALMVFFLPIANAIIESCFGAIFLCAIIKGIVLRPKFKAIKDFFSDRANLSLLIFYIGISFSIITAGHLWVNSFKAWFFKWGEAVLLFYLAQIFLKRRQVLILLVVIILSGFLLGIDGIYQKITGSDFIWGYLQTRSSNFLAPRASFAHYNDFATFLNVVFFITIAFLMHFKRNRGVQTLLTLLLALIIINIFLTQSRGAWFTFFMVNIFLIGLHWNKNDKLLFFISLTIFLIGIFTVPFLRQRLFFIWAKGGDADRFKVWTVALTMFKESPWLGKGIGTFMALFRQYEILLPQYAHNCYLQILAETGVIGFVCFLWFLFTLIRQAWSAIIRKSDLIRTGLFAALASFLIHMFFDTQLYTLKLSALFWVIASMLVILCRDNDNLVLSKDK